MTIRLTQFEPAKAASLAMPVDIENPAKRLSVQASTRQPSTQTLSLRPIVFFLIGSLLTATAVAKLWMLLTDSYADVRVGLPKEILWLSVALEFWLAYLNFRLCDQRVMVFVNTIVFTSFGVFATIRLKLGYGFCGCSGSLELPAWIFILIDLAFVGWFTRSCCQRSRVGAGYYQFVQNGSAWSPEKRGRWVGIGMLASLIIVLQPPFTASLRARCWTNRH